MLPLAPVFTRLFYLDGFFQPAAFQNFKRLQNLIWAVLTQQLNELLCDAGWQMNQVLVDAFSGK